VRVGQTNLVRAYRAAAERCAAMGDAGGSVTFLEKCLEVTTPGLALRVQGLRFRV